MSPRSISVRLAAVRRNAQLLLEHAEGHAGRLFYRLNIIHLMAVDGPSSLTREYDAQDVDVIEPSAPKLPR